MAVSAAEQPVVGRLAATSLTAATPRLNLRPENPRARARSGYRMAVAVASATTAVPAATLVAVVAATEPMPVEAAAAAVVAGRRVLGAPPVARWPTLVKKGDESRLSMGVLAVHRAYGSGSARCASFARVGVRWGPRCDGYFRCGVRSQRVCVVVRRHAACRIAEQCVSVREFGSSGPVIYAVF